MSSIPEDYQQGLQEGAQDLKGLLWAERDEDTKLVQKGLLLYRQGLVSSVRLADMSIQSVVQDVTRVSVELNLSFISASTCSCPADGLCRHIMATFFSMYGRMASVTDWVEEWRLPLQESKRAHTWGIQHAKDLMKREKNQPPDYQRWRANFQEGFQSMVSEKINGKMYLVSPLLHAYMKKMQAEEPLQQEWRHLYRLIGHFHTFCGMVRHIDQNEYKSKDIERYFLDDMSQLMHEMDSLLSKLNVQALPFAFDPFIEELKKDSALLLEHDEFFSFEVSHLYVLLWTKLFKKKYWHEEALEVLEKSARTYPKMIATTHHNILLRQDNNALALMKVLNSDVTPFLLTWIEKLMESKEWKRLIPYVDLFLINISDYLDGITNYYARYDFTRFAIRVMTAYSRDSKRQDVYEKVLLHTLPYSYRQYDEYLFDSGDYKKWSDLHSYLGYDLGGISNERIRFLQKEAPEILLPLYHQSIMEHIGMKNRSHYREAVRELKKLRTLYKKLKRVDDWQQFLEQLLERTKRLRAFQQECERGKLHA